MSDDLRNSEAEVAALAASMKARNEAAAPSEATETETFEPVETQETPTTESPVEQESGGDVETGEAEESGKGSSTRAERRRQAAERSKQELETARREADAARQALERIKSAGSLPDRPKPEDFETDLEHFAADAVWQQSKAVADREAAQAEQQVKDASEREAQARNAGFSAQVDALAEIVPDMRDKINVAVNAPVNISQEVSDLIMGDDDAAHILYHLGNNPDALKSLDGASPIQAAMQIGAMKSQLITKQAPRAKASTAPAPLNRVKGSGKAQRSPHNMSPEQYREWRKNGGGR